MGRISNSSETDIYGSHNMMKLLPLLLLSVTLVSCVPPPPPLAPAPSAPENNPQSLIGLSEAEATHRAGLMGLSYRVVKRDGISYPVTMDYSESRLNFTISHGRVIAVTRG